ncbi:C40 family peptidase [Streptomyces noursei]|uniref:C40 family peptidase n=1 Tax=Streptomyces noursei TaxID=1971 RepID=UPI0021A3F68B|nr:C40 family peptidase [Streptomyces noursei]UWS77573.1 C40 family peptidase [Streptomyces noursei]
MFRRRSFGFDCRHCTQFAYGPASNCPRVASDQYGATAGKPVVAANSKSGTFFSGRSRSGGIYHVAMYYGDGKIIQAPRTEEIEIVPISQAMPERDYYGATRAETGKSAH